MEQTATLKVMHAPVSGNNPYQGLLFEQLENEGVQVLAVPFSDIYGWMPLLRRGARSCDLVHIHWVHAFYQTPGTMRSAVKALVFMLELALLRLSGVSLVWTVHDKKTHDAPYPRLDKMARLFLAGLCHRVVVHCQAARQWAISEWSLAGDKVFVIPHGSLLSRYPDEVSRDEARSKLGFKSKDKLLLFFGTVRPDKGLQTLLSSFYRIRNQDARLLVAGRVRDPAIEDFLQDAVRRDSRVSLHQDFVPDSRVQYFMRAADVVVLPYQEILTSSVLVLAMDFGKAVVAPRMGCLPEQMAKTGGVLFNPDDPEGLERALAAVLEADTERMGENNRRKSHALSWPDIAKSLIEVYREAAG